MCVAVGDVHALLEEAPYPLQCRLDTFQLRVIPNERWQYMLTCKSLQNTHTKFESWSHIPNKYIYLKSMLHIYCCLV